MAGLGCGPVRRGVSVNTEHAQGAPKDRVPWAQPACRRVCLELGAPLMSSCFLGLHVKEGEGESRDTRDQPAPPAASWGAQLGGGAG